MHFPLSPSENSIKGGEGEGERGWKKLLCKPPIWKYHKHNGRRLLLQERVEPLKKPQSIYFSVKLSLFIAVSHARDTDHGVGLNSTPTEIIIYKHWIRIFVNTFKSYSDWSTLDDLIQNYICCSLTIGCDNLIWVIGVVTLSVSILYN